MSILEFLAIARLARWIGGGVSKLVKHVRKKKHLRKVEKAKRKEEIMRAQWRKRIQLAQREVVELERIAEEKDKEKRKAQKDYIRDLREYERYREENPVKLDELGDVWPGGI